MIQLTLTLLGPFQAEVAGQTLHFPTDKVRALLAYLAIEQGRPHRREMLATLLWPNQPDAQARRNLRLTLHRLKQTLDNAAPEANALSDALLTASRSTVQWHGSAAQTDYAQFINLLTQVEKHDHPQLETCSACLEKLEKSVSLLQGGLLVGLSIDDAVPFEEWLLIQREFIHNRALRLYGTLANIYETRGDYPRALRHAQQQLALEPWYEAAHRQAMRALALSGDRDRALAQFETCRAVLWEELGVEPAPETAVLYQQIRDNALSAQPAAVPLHHIPADLTPFIGRSTELAHITAELGDPDCRLLTLIGPGGIGKTRLAIEAAQRLAASTPDHCHAIYVVPLAAATTRQTAVTTLADSLGITLSGTDDPLQELLQFLRPHKWLLLLDNLEQLPNATTLVADILQKAPDVQILATSREPLQLHGERRLPLTGLPCPTTAAKDNVRASPAVALFVQSARQMAPGFRLDAAAETAVSKLCQLVDGMPLALELAAGWVRVMDCPAILRETEQNLAFLATDLHQVPARHRSLHAIFRQTWTMLPAHLQRVLAQAALFPGSFTLAALQAIVPDATMLDVATLLDKSLLHRNMESHYELHPLLKQFAAQQSTASADWQKTFSRYYLHEVAQREAALFGAAPQKTLRQIRHDLVNIRQAWLWGVAHQLWAEMGAALPALSRFYQMAGLFAEAVEGAAHTLAALDDGLETAVLRTQLLLHYSHFLGQQGQYEMAISQAEAALALAQSLQNNQLLAQGLAQVGEWQRHQGWFTTAEETLAEALALFPDCPTPPLAAAHNEVGFTHLRRGQYPAARRAFQTALAIFAELGDQSGTAVTLGNLGYLAQVQAQYGEAQAFLAQALSQAQTIGDRQSIVKHTLGLGWTALQQGDMDQAQVHQQAALRLAEQIGYLRGALTARRHMADTCLFQNKLDEAEQGYRRLLMQAQQASLKDMAAYATGSLGIVYARRSDYDTAVHQYEAAMDLCRELDDNVGLCKHLGNLGIVYRRQGQYDQARRIFTDVLQRERAAGLRQSEANTLMNLGAVCRQQHDFATALAYFERALAIYEKLNHKDGIGKSLGFLGLMHQDAGEYKVAIERYEMAQALSETMGDRLTAAVWRLNIAEVYVLMEEWETAVPRLEDALATFRALNSKQYMANGLHCKAKILRAQGQLAAARLTAKESMALAEGIGETKSAQESGALLAQIEAEMKVGNGR